MEKQKKKMKRNYNNSMILVMAIFSHFNFLPFISNLIPYKKGQAQYLLILNLFQQMKLLFQAALLAMVLTLATASLGVFMSQGIPSVALMQCVLRSGYKYATWGEESTSQGVDTNVTASLTNIKAAGLATDLAFVPCKGLGLTKEVEIFLQKVPKNLVDRIWLDADDNSNEQQCKWKSADKSANCAKLQQYAIEFKKQGFNVGIISNQEDYDEFLGRCDWTASERLYWDPKAPNDDPSFADFRPFGGWRRPSRKLYHYIVSVCGEIVSAAYEP